MPYDIGQDFEPLTVPAVMPKTVRRITEDGTPTQAQLDWEQSLQAWTRDNVANTNRRLTLVKEAADGLEASVAIETEARIDGDEALASYDLTLLSRVDDISASGELKFETKAAPTGATASFGMYLTAGDTFAGIEALALSTGGSAIAFTANKFLFVDSGTAQPVLSYSSGTFKLNTNVEILGNKVSITAANFLFTDSGTATPVMSYSGGLWTINSNVKINGNLNINNGTVVTDNVATSQITQADGSSSGGSSASVSINTRAGAKVLVIASFNGAAGVYFPLGTFIGQSSIVENGSTLQVLNNNFEASGTGASAGVALLQTSLLAVSTPSPGWNTYYVYNTNGGGIGGVTIAALEVCR
jgi:hypothetical protein